MSTKRQRNRRAVAFIVIIIGIISSVLLSGEMWQPTAAPPSTAANTATGSAADLLASIAIKGRAPKTGYERTQYGDGWATTNGCDTRNIILHRDMEQVVSSDGCKVDSGNLNDPYTGKMIAFTRGAGSSDVQIDHVVALSDSWQKGAQQLTALQRKTLANDPLELLAVDGPANQAKGDGDAATWLPANKVFRCQYVARQIAVKSKYSLWMTQAEHDAITSILANCPGQILPSK